MVIAGLLGAGLGPMASAAGDVRDADVARTETGLVRGSVSGTVRAFDGIPYAAPPVGALRWQAPRPAAPWPGVRDATQPGDRCAQNPSPVAGTAGSSSEDCLYLNITTPVDARRALPVLVYLHGGGLSSGAGSDLEPRRLATREQAVVVTLNYRLGVFGFYGAPGLAGSGTFGLQDQQAALAWVRRNIGGFGGNSRDVTLFGESGGGDSVCAHLASPAAWPLIDRAVVQSGTCSDANPVDALYPGAGAAVASWQPLSTLENTGSSVATALGCSAADLSCLRALPASRLLTDKAVAAVYWSPAYDTPVLPLRPAAAIAVGRFAHVPLMIGTTRDEGTLLVALSGQAEAPAAYRDLLSRAFGARADTVEAAYPAGTQPAKAWAAIVGDRGYVCPNQDSARTLAHRTRTYAYEFADSAPPLIFHLDPAFPLGAYHASDVPYLWDTRYRLNPAQQRLSDQMLDYLGQFAATGDPNGPGTPHWPAVHPGSPVPVVQRLTPDAVGPTTTAAAHHCPLWTDGATS
ncbi:carboxylesterase/lipase family protein [Amycolatopsis sp. NPDC088138]|uniref:carboxylesterase/lipase family protein n=1 Tax=Amycolatopsis sp. NPDC088138 TaxID=3363938 RepID=UPI00382040AC